MDGGLDEIWWALGSPVVSVRDAPWGSRNQTAVVTLADGRRLVVQRYRDSSAAAQRLHALRQLGPPLNERGVRTPSLVACDLDAPIAWAAFDVMDGEVGYVACRDDLSAPSFTAIARRMGQINRVFRQLDSTEFDLPAPWADLDLLVADTHGWLADLAPYLAAKDRGNAARIIDRAPCMLRDRPITVCHGDYGPQNVLVVARSITGVLDFEDARLADPLLDIAWWAWIVRAHTPEAFGRSWRRFLSAANIDSTTPQFEQRLLTLIVLRLLETASTYHRTRHDDHEPWARRLTHTLNW